MTKDSYDYETIVLNNKTEEIHLKKDQAEIPELKDQQPYNPEESLIASLPFTINFN